MKNFILFASIAVASGVLFVNIYNSFIDTKSWGSDISNSIAAARNYFKVTNPGNFFRVFSPLNQILALITLILFWKSPANARTFLIAAVALYVMADVLTFAYFYPRNDFMFKNAALSDIDALKKTWSEWDKMNWVRTSIVLGGLVCSFLALKSIISFK